MTTTVPTAAEQAAQPQIGTRTLCQHPGCGRPIELVPPAGPPDPVDHPVWAHVLFGTWVGPDHEATAVEQPEPSTDHDFLPVAGHPDDDECTHRSDGTDATYCGLPATDHEPSPGELLVASVQQSYEAHRQAQTLPVEAFTNPEELATHLCRAAEAYGLNVDRGPGSLRAQVRIAAVLLDTLLSDRDTAMEQAAEEAGRMVLETAGGEQR